jgi:hypothetical protein
MMHVAVIGEEFRNDLRGATAAGALFAERRSPSRAG